MAISHSGENYQVFKKIPAFSTLVLSVCIRYKWSECAFIQVSQYACGGRRTTKGMVPHLLPCLIQSLCCCFGLLGKTTWTGSFQEHVSASYLLEGDH